LIVSDSLIQENSNFGKKKIIMTKTNPNSLINKSSMEKESGEILEFQLLILK